MLVRMPETDADKDALLELVRKLTVERDAAQAKLDRATKAREILLAGISHDLRNPLNTFAMSAGLLRDDFDRGEADATRGLSLLKRMERALERMQRLIEDLGEASRFEGGRVEIARKPEPLSRLVTDAVAAAKPVVEERSVSIAEEGPAPDAAVLVDKQRIVQAFAKLAGYAVRIVGDGGAIRVSASVADGTATIAMRASAARSAALPAPEESRGGLALLLARGVAELHGGSLTVTQKDALDVALTLPLA